MPSRARPAWCVYLLWCGDGTSYVGCTNALARRIAQHASGRGARYTRGRGPLTLAWSRRVPDRSSALRLEAAVKRLPRRGRDALAAGDRAVLARVLERARLAVSSRAPPRGSARRRAAPRAPARRSAPRAQARGR